MAEVKDGRGSMAALPPRRLSPARRLTEEDLTHYGRSAKGSEPHITRTPSRVDSGPDQALQLHDRPLWGSIATLDDPISLHEWLHALPEGHRPLGGHPNPLNVDSSAVEITTRGVALPQIGEVELSRRVGPVAKLEQHRDQPESFDGRTHGRVY